MSVLDLFPPHDSAFDSAWLKWGQAVLHAQKLQAQLDSFGKRSQREPLFTIRSEYNAKRHGLVVYVQTIEPIPRVIGLSLADMVGNFRSCLDHLAWELVRRGKTPPDTLSDRTQKGIYFPIYEDRVKFNAALASKLPGVGRADVAIVRRYQPYLSGRRKSRWHVFASLEHINNANKHRTIQPIWTVPITAEYQISDMRDCEMGRAATRAFRRPLEVDAELTVIRVRKTGPNPRAKVEPHVTAEPGLNNRQLLSKWITITEGWTFLLLRDFARPPEELMDVGTDWSRLNLDPDIDSYFTSFALAT